MTFNLPSQSMIIGGYILKVDVDLRHVMYERLGCNGKTLAVHCPSKEVTVRSIHDTEMSNWMQSGNTTIIILLKLFRIRLLVAETYIYGCVNRQVYFNSGVNY